MDTNKLFCEFRGWFGYKIAVADNDQYLWSKLLRDNGLKFKVLGSWVKPGWEYRCMILRLRRRDKGKVPSIAKRVDDTFAIMGFKDYKDFRDLLFGTVLVDR